MSGWREVLDGAAAWSWDTGPSLPWLRTLPSDSVDCVVTSPPYLWLRSYLDASHPDKLLEIGAEDSPLAFVAVLVELFGEVRRVLTAAGTLWVNIGDTYAGDAKGPGSKGGTLQGRPNLPAARKPWRAAGLKKGERLGVPHRLAFALQDAGWRWRDEIVWDKPNPLPKSVRNRTTDAHEMVFMFSKSARYFWNHADSQESAAWAGKPRGSSNARASGQAGAALNGKDYQSRNPRSVWRITPERRRVGDVKHTALMPVELARRAVRAGCPRGGVVLDPFGGLGTTLVAALELGCRAIGNDLNPDYGAPARRRLAAVTPTLIGA